MKVATHADQGEASTFLKISWFSCSSSACAERLLHCGWTMSEEGTMAALVPVSSAFHRDMCDLKMIMAKLVLPLKIQLSENVILVDNSPESPNLQVFSPQRVGHHRHPGQHQEKISSQPCWEGRQSRDNNLHL